MQAIDRRRVSMSHVLFFLLLVVAVFRPFEGVQALAQSAEAKRHPVDLAVVVPRTDGNANLVYRMWSDGSIDVRLYNPLDMPANHWPQSDRAGLSFQEGWKVLQVGP